MSKKLHAKDLKKQDEFVQAGSQFLDRASRWLSEHGRTVLAGFAALVVIAVVWSILDWRAAVQETETLDQLSQAVDALDETSSAEADVAASLEEAETQLAELAESGARTPAARLGRYYAGVVALRRGRADEAVAQLSAFVEKNGESPLVPHALSVLAAAQEEAGDLAAAQGTLESLASGQHETYPRDAALMELGRFHARHGRDGEAEEIFRTLAEDDEFAESSYAGLARQRLAS